MNTPATTLAHDARTLLKTLHERFPVFRDHQPLAIGIDKQLHAVEAGIDRKLLRIALGMHTHSYRYLKSMERATQRFNLDGTPGGEVLQEHRKHATDTLRERFRKEVARRAAQKEAEEAERRHAEKLNRLVAKFGKTERKVG